MFSFANPLNALGKAKYIAVVTALPIASVSFVLPEAFSITGSAGLPTLELGLEAGDTYLPAAKFGMYPEAKLRFLGDLSNVFITS